ncbi:MAG: OmpA family protein, partial [Bacteroidota bacterium]
LYFASNGHEGLGGLDIYTAKNFMTSEPQLKNIGYPVNSPKDDFGLIMDEKRGVGFFSSNRVGGEGDDDIYSFRKLQVAKAMVVDKATGDPIPYARVDIFDINDRLVGSTRTGEDGIAHVGIRPNQDYKAVVNKEEYLPADQKISSRGIPLNQDIVAKIPLEKSDPCPPAFVLDGNVKEDNGSLAPGTRVLIKTKDRVLVADENGKIDANLLPESDYTLVVDDPVHRNKPYEVTTKGKPSDKPIPLDIILRRPELGDVFFIIYYDYDKYNIRGWDARPELDLVVDYMTQNPNIKVLLTSHTDARASFPYNITLSKNRATEAFTYITSKGIAKDRLRFEWKGEHELTNECADGVECSEEKHQLNRRTEFKFDGFVGKK